MVVWQLPTVKQSISGVPRTAATRAVKPPIEVFLGVGALLEQQFDDARVAGAGGHHERRVLMLIDGVIGVGASVEQGADGARLVLVNRVHEGSRPRDPAIDGFPVRAQLQQHAYGVGLAVPGGAHERRDIQHTGAHDMEYVNLGRTGLKVSRLCLGCMTYGTPAWRPWVLTRKRGRPFIRRPSSSGINFFDTADMYSLGVSEEVVGRALRDFAPRDQVVIATKVFFPMGDGPNDRGLSRKHILDAIDASLRRLGVDYVDLYQIHRCDPDTPIEETLDALTTLCAPGKVRYIGASSMYAWQFAKALLPGRPARLGPLRVHAEPLQPRSTARRSGR